VQQERLDARVRGCPASAPARPPPESQRALQAKLAKLRRELLEPTSGSGAGAGKGEGAPPADAKVPCQAKAGAGGWQWVDAVGSARCTPW